MAHKNADVNGFNYEQFADSLFGLYQQNSFGSVSKRELDLFLFANFKRWEGFKVVSRGTSRKN